MKTDREELDELREEYWKLSQEKEIDEPIFDLIRMLLVLCGGIAIGVGMGHAIY